MLEFSNNPPLEPTKQALPMLRTPANGKLVLLLTCQDLLGCFTHYFGGRSTPCTGDPCEPCQAGSSMRWHGYVCGIVPKTHEHSLLEITRAAAETLAAYRVKNGTLRGCLVIATRVAPRANARLHLELKPYDLSTIDLPASANIQAALCNLWGIPITETQIVHGDLGAPNVAHKGTPMPPDPGNGQIPPKTATTAAATSKPVRFKHGMRP